MAIFKRLYRLVAVIAAAAVLLLSAVITVADGAIGWIPSWYEIFAWAGFCEPPVSEDELRVTVLDVGNADCILIQSGKQAALIDAGEGQDRRKVIKALHLRGITRLEYVLATHADVDHIGAMPDVVREMEIGTFLMPYMSYDAKPDSRTFAELEAALSEKELPITAAKYGMVCPIGKATLTVISGRSEPHYASSNERSLVCRLTFGEHAILLMGDAGESTEKRLLATGVNVQADVIKVGHHGSSSSSSTVFMEAVKPAYAVITCGFDNGRGHPHEKTLQTLQAVGATVYRSDLNGTIVIASDGHTLSVSSER